MNLKLILFLLFFVGQICSYAQTLFPFTKDDKWFLVDKKMRPINDNRYIKIEPSGNNFFYANKGDKWGIINNKGIEITSFLFENIRFDITYKVFFVKQNEEDKIINLNGEFLDTTFMGYCGGGILINTYFPQFKENGKYGFDKPNKKQFPPILDSIVETNSNLAFVLKDGKWGILNNNGRFRQRPIFSSFEIYTEQDFKFEGAIVKRDSGFGWVDKKGKITVKTEYKKLSNFNHGYALVETFDGKKGYINMKGKEFFK